MEIFDYLTLPNTDVKIYPGSRIRIHRFDNEIWLVSVGWYAWGGNREVCGWYLTSESTGKIKPLQRPDLEDAYAVIN